MILGINTGTLPLGLYILMLGVGVYLLNYLLVGLVGYSTFKLRYLLKSALNSSKRYADIEIKQHFLKESTIVSSAATTAAMFVIMVTLLQLRAF